MTDTIPDHVGREAVNLSEKLEQLSAAATQGEWFSVEIKGHAGWSQIGSTVDDHKEWPCGDAGDNDAPFIVALVNLYRTGQLVAVQADDAIERVKAENEALLIALHDAIRRPMGVVPASADQFYSPAMADRAQAIRALKSPKPPIL